MLSQHEGPTSPLHAVTQLVSSSPAAQLTRPDTVKAGLTAKRPRREIENGEYAAFVRRILRACSRRVGDGDVEALVLMLGLAEEIDTAIAEAVKGLRGHDYSWAEIGSRLGVTRQAAEQRWGAVHRRRLGRVFTETAYGPAHTVGTAIHNARCDQAVQRRQVRRPEPGHHGSEVVRPGAQPAVRGL